MADTNELIDVCTDLIRLVEGVGCKDWRDQNGQRFKDTNEWVRAYVAINNARKESREQAVHPADAALADDSIIELVTDYAQSKVRAASCLYRYESSEYDKEAAETLEQIRAALRARAVPERFVDAANRAKNITADVLRTHPETYVAHIHGLADLILTLASRQSQETSVPKVLNDVLEIHGSHPRDDLSHDPLVKECRPVGAMLEASFQQYDGTNVCQWHARVGDSPLWKPRGPMFRLDDSKGGE